MGKDLALVAHGKRMKYRAKLQELKEMNHEVPADLLDEPSGD